jgi:16S rRNA (cytosine1402-N4)-methyltransferase
LIDGADYVHQPVLVAETLGFLAPESGVFVDCTLGLGGHAEALLEAAPAASLVGIDRDPEALLRAARRLERFGDRVRMVEGRFDELERHLNELGIERVEGIFADLGVSSMQLDAAHRGFSFRFDAPLDMRMGGDGETAGDIVNQSSEKELERIFREYGEERRARRIARSIVRVREDEPIETTTQLRDLIRRAKRTGPGRREGRVDPATRAFQALRIAVNRELAGLEDLLGQAVRLLDTGGRLVVISYHSLEDRIVKGRLRDYQRGEIDEITGRPLAETQILEVLTRKPVRPSEEEVVANPRSRSARLRAARRL